jgi:hypothetical protein
MVPTLLERDDDVRESRQLRARTRRRRLPNVRPTSLAAPPSPACETSTTSAGRRQLFLPVATGVVVERGDPALQGLLS